MAIVNTLLGGSDTSDNDILTHTNLNDTFNATYNLLRGTVRFAESTVATEYSQGDTMTAKITKTLTVNSTSDLILGVDLDFETKSQSAGAVDIMVKVAWTDEASDARVRNAVCQLGNQYVAAAGGAIFYSASGPGAYTRYQRSASFNDVHVTALNSTGADEIKTGTTLTSGATEYVITVLIGGNNGNVAYIQNTTLRVYWIEAIADATALA